MGVPFKTVDFNLKKILDISKKKKLKMCQMEYPLLRTSVDVALHALCPSNSCLAMPATHTASYTFYIVSNTVLCMEKSDKFSSALDRALGRQLKKVSEGKLFFPNKNNAELSCEYSSRDKLMVCL